MVAELFKFEDLSIAAVSARRWHYLLDVVILDLNSAIGVHELQGPSNPDFANERMIIVDGRYHLHDVLNESDAVRDTTYMDKAKKAVGMDH